jgi:site-specific recombinase XerD
MRRALGYKLTDHGRVLPQFAAFLAQRDEPLITTALALEFATQPGPASVAWWHMRLAIVRGFARYLQASDTRHEVPPANLLPAKSCLAVPYLFSEPEIQALMRAARSMRPPPSAASCEAVIGLLSVTGTRVSEVCALDRSDVELRDGRLTVRHAKNGRSREIPLHPSTVAALESYVRARDQLGPYPKDPAAFFSPAGEDDRAGRRSDAGSIGCDARPALTAKRLVAKPGCTTSAMPSCCARSRAGIARAPTSRHNCRCSRPCWATSTRPTHTRISRRARTAGAGVRAARADLERADHTSARERTSPPAALPEALQTDAARPLAATRGPTVSALAALLQAFFTERLARQGDADPHTTASYRGSFRLLLTFLHQQTVTTPTKLQLEDLDTARITAFPLIPGERARQQCQDTERAADRGPLVLPLEVPSTTCTRVRATKASGRTISE